MTNSDNTQDMSLSGHSNYDRLLRTMCPMVLMMLVASIYSILDGFFIARFVGTDAFAGMNIILPVVAIIGALGLMVGAGSSALVSKTLGEGDKDRAERVFSVLISFTLIASAILATILFVFMPDVASMLGADAVLLPYAVRYGRILTLALPFYMLMMAFNPFYMVIGKPSLGTKITTVSGIVNVSLDLILILLLDLGLTGAAVSSALGFIVGGAFPLWYFSRSRSGLKIEFTSQWHGTDWRNIGKCCGNGVSEFVADISLNVVGICYNWQLMRYIGADGVAAYGILMNLSFLFNSVFMGYNMGVQQFVAYNYGEQNHSELTSLLRKSRVVVGIGGVLLWLVGAYCAPIIATTFVGNGNNVHEITVHAAHIYAISFLFSGLNMFASTWFTALGNGFVSAAVSFVRTLVLELAAVFTLPLLFGIDGIWSSVIVAEVLALLLSSSLISLYRKKYGY
ncbi:MATE family efflux transporter [Phocaeicola dorei]|uniref:MATE family efflux transporter n=1 Tax=Phocaeicola dorei TaxID=357276 RepID=UPI0039B5B7D5